jgi:hypothetical protein
MQRKILFNNYMQLTIWHTCCCIAANIKQPSRSITMNTIRRNVTAFALVLTLGTAGAAVAAQTTTGSAQSPAMNHQMHQQAPGHMNHETGGHMMSGHGMGAHRLMLTEEQQKQYDAIVKKTYADTAKVRSELWARSAELDALRMNPNASPEMFAPLADAIAGLRTTLDTARMDMNDKLEKALGISLPLRHGMFLTGGAQGCGMKGMKGMKGMMHKGAHMQKGMMHKNAQSAQLNNAESNLVACLGGGSGSRMNGLGHGSNGGHRNQAAEPVAVSFAL